MAGWDGNANWSRDVLERIVALLFALAGLADLAAGASFHRRRQVLQILSFGEAEARAYVIGVAAGESVPADALETIHDAARLAASFRALALMLCVLLAQATLSAVPGAIDSQSGRPSQKTSGSAVRWPGAPALPAPDTS
jgi:hypothetical protein